MGISASFVLSHTNMALTCASAFTSKAPAFVQTRGRSTGRVALPLSPVCSTKRVEQTNAQAEVSQCPIVLRAVSWVRDTSSRLSCHQAGIEFFRRDPPRAGQLDQACRRQHSSVNIASSRQCPGCSGSCSLGCSGQPSQHAATLASPCSWLGRLQHLGPSIEPAEGHAKRQA